MSHKKTDSSGPTKSSNFHRPHTPLLINSSMLLPNKATSKLPSCTKDKRNFFLPNLKIARTKTYSQNVGWRRAHALRRPQDVSDTLTYQPGEIAARGGERCVFVRYIYVVCSRRRTLSSCGLIKLFIPARRAGHLSRVSACTCLLLRVIRVEMAMVINFAASGFVSFSYNI